MGRSFRVLATVLLAVFMAWAEPRALAAAVICQERSEQAEIAALNRFMDSALREHALFGPTRATREKQKAKAKEFLDRLLEDRARACADHLKVSEDLEREPAKWSSPECASSAMVSLIENHVAKVELVKKKNQLLLLGRRNDHIKELKQIFVDLARGSNVGLTPAVASQSRAVRAKMITDAATRLVAEADRAWGRLDVTNNPFVRHNEVMAKESQNAAKDLLAAKRAFGANRAPASQCVRKP
jgi:hypothetical protein